MTARRLASIAAFAALPLAGCISLTPKPPSSLMTLSALTPLPPGPARTTDEKRSIAVSTPTVGQALATQRVMVSDGPTALAYLKDGQWAAPPAQLFRALLAETITVKTGRVVPDPRTRAAQPDLRLTGQLAEFELDGPGYAAVVTFDAAISRAGSPALQARRFSARVPVAVEDPAHVGVAINQAANQVAGEVADWVGQAAP
jgi:cholesterol transport system auxiliary component